MLASIARIFDPLGLVLPVVAKAKLFLKNLWQLGLGWDEPLNPELSEEWSKLSRDFSNLSKVEFDRSACRGDITLYVFCDSSKRMYGFSCYARFSEGSEVKTNLLYAKSKCAPNKGKSLPTLELLSVFLAMKCIPTLISGLRSTCRITDVIICVDSQVALSWILTGK